MNLKSRNSFHYLATLPNRLEYYFCPPCQTEDYLVKKTWNRKIITLPKKAISYLPKSIISSAAIAAKVDVCIVRMDSIKK